MATLARDLLLSVSTTLQDINPQFRRWGEIELIRYANYAQMALAKYLPQVSSRTDDIKLAAGARQSLAAVLAANIKPGDGSAAADAAGIAFMRAVCNMGTDGLTVGRSVRGPVDRYTKDAFEPGWQTEVGAEVREIVFDRNQPLQFFASPGSSGNTWLRIEWMANLPRLPDGGAPGSEKYVPAGTEASRMLSVPEQFAEDMHNYIVAAALTKGSKNTINVPKAQMHATMFANSVNQQAMSVTGVNPNIAALPFINEIT